MTFNQPDPTQPGDSEPQGSTTPPPLPDSGGAPADFTPAPEYGQTQQYQPGQTPSYPPPAYGQPSAPPPVYGQPSAPPPAYGQPTAPPAYGQQNYGQQGYGAPAYGQPAQPTYGQPYPGAVPPAGYAPAAAMNGGDARTIANGRPVVLTSFGARIGAYILDAVICWIMLAIMFGIGFGIIFGTSHDTGRLTTCHYSDGTTYTCNDIAFNGAAVAAGIVIIIIGCILPFLYQWLLLAKTGSTIGKKAVGATVVDEATGGPITTGRAFVRTLMFAVPLDVISPFFDSNYRQGWHDKVGKTLVVDKSSVGL